MAATLRVRDEVAPPSLSSTSSIPTSSDTRGGKRQRTISAYSGAKVSLYNEERQLSPLLREWVDSYDGVRPILEYGAGYGGNVIAASIELSRAVRDDPLPRTRILAAEFCDLYLHVINRSNSLQGVETLRCSLPALPVPPQSLSGIMLSENLHFMRPDEIEAAISCSYDRLAPGGRLCITALSPFCARGRLGELIRHTYAVNQNSKAFPLGAGFNLQEIVREDPLIFEGACHRHTVHDMPTYVHPLGEAELVRVCTGAGFSVESLGYRSCASYPSALRCDGREQICVVARKPLC